MPYVSPFPKPTPRQRELLDCLIEECSEIIQRATKAGRFGMLETQEGQDLTNFERIGGECGDLLAVIDLLIRENWFTARDLREAQVAKAVRLEHWLQTIA